MRFLSFLTAALSLVSLATLALGQEGEEILVESEHVGPQLVAAAVWPETNPFGHVVNGEKNTMNILLENKLNKNVTLLNVAGAIYQPETEKLIKNLTSLAYGIQLLEDVKLQLPYAFYSEFKPGDVRLTVWLEHLDADVKERVTVYDSIVTIVEPEGSLFDFKLISTYLIVSAFVGGLVYVAYLSFFPQTKKSRKSAPPVSVPVGTVTATGAGGYQEEWIPEHHLRKPKATRKKSGAVSSGDELSGGETSGTEGKRRKAKK